VIVELPTTSFEPDPPIDVVPSLPEMVIEFGPIVVVPPLPEMTIEPDITESIPLILGIFYIIIIIS
jgi:hypothetical protein